MTGRHVGQNRLKTVSGRSHAWFRKFGAQTFLVFESREETQIRPIVQGGKKDFFLLLLLDQAGEFLGPKQQHVRGGWVQPIILFPSVSLFLFLLNASIISQKLLMCNLLAVTLCVRVSVLVLASVQVHGILLADFQLLVRIIRQSS